MISQKVEFSPRRIRMTPAIFLSNPFMDVNGRLKKIMVLNEGGREERWRHGID
jgi:hypothetical protein